MKVRIMVMSFLVLLICIVYAASAFAEEGKFEFNPSYGMREVLSAYAGKRVSLRLGASEPLEGTVTKVGTHLVHISQLTGKDFYDAVVSIDKIEAVILKVRGK